MYPIPFAWLDRVAAGLVFVLGPFLPSAFTRVRENLSAAFPDMPAQEMDVLVRRNVINTVRVFLEVFQVYKFRKKKNAAKYMRFAEESTLTDLSERDAGIVVIQGHFGNWEIPIIWYAHHGVSVPFVLKRQSNPLVDNWMLKVRSIYGANAYYMEDSKGILKELKSGSVIGLVCDQDAGPGGQFAQFFGRSASCFPGPALMSFIQGSRMMLTTCVFQGKGKYELSLREIEPPIQKADFANSKDAIAKLTQKWCDVLEDEIRRHPEQYFWMHRRWKSQPQPQEDVT